MPLDPSPSAPSFPSLLVVVALGRQEFLAFQVCHSILECQNILEQRRISEKKKNVRTADWVYVLDVRCYIYSSVQVAQEFLLDDDAKYFRRNK